MQQAAALCTAAAPKRRARTALARRFSAAANGRGAAAALAAAPETPSCFFYSSRISTCTCSLETPRMTFAPLCHPPLPRASCCWIHDAKLLRQRRGQQPVPHTPGDKHASCRRCLLRRRCCESAGYGRRGMRCIRLTRLEVEAGCGCRPACYRFHFPRHHHDTCTCFC